MKLLKAETHALRKRLVNKTIRNVECYHSADGDSHIKIFTDNGAVIIGANDLGIWTASNEEMKNG